jgi:hypothetical protein
MLDMRTLKAVNQSTGKWDFVQNPKYAYPMQQGAEPLKSLHVVERGRSASVAYGATREAASSPTPST